MKNFVLSLVHASPVYELYGYDSFIAFADRFLK